MDKIAVSKSGEVPSQAWSGREWDIGQNSLCERRNHGVWDLVIHERLLCRRVDDRPHAHEISGAQISGWKGSAEGDSFEDSAAFVVTENKSLIALYRSIQARSKLILTERRLDRTVEEVPCVQYVVPQEFIRRAMPHVAARFGRDVNLCAAVAAEFCRIVARMDLEFLNCINRRRDCETLIDFVANGHAIEQENVYQLVPGTVAWIFSIRYPC